MKLDLYYPTDYLARFIETAPEEIILGADIYQTQVVEKDEHTEFTVHFLSPHNVGVTLAWRSFPGTNHFIIPDVSIYVQDGFDNLLAFRGDNTKDIKQTNLRRVVETALTDLIAEGAHRYFTEDPAAVEERARTNQRLDLLDQNL
jgi:hypothetical protein